jgi:spermidine synthase
MGIELVAGRMMAREVGASLYAWTSVIGVILAGITAGNFFGGRIADRFEARKTLGVLFFLASLAAVSILLLDFEAGKWLRWDEPGQTLSWPLRIAIHTTLVFFIPSASLGLLGPVIAKWALDRGSEAGRTVGNVYAWGALGSILGTFLAGFYLIQALGTGGVLFAVGGVLATLGVLLSARSSWTLLAVTWPLFLVGLFVLYAPEGTGSQEWVWAEGKLVLEDHRAPAMVYQKESQYSHVRVTEARAKASEGSQEARYLYLDNLLHAVCVPGEPARLEYGYEKIYALLTERFGRAREDLSALFLGGGGYVFPRYVKARWPRSKLEVAEIDPAVTQANFAAFGLRPEEVRIVEAGDPAALPGAAGAGESASRPIEAYHLDARNHVEDLLKRKAAGGGFEPFDFVYGDAFNDFSVPFHLVTVEFSAKVRDLLRPETGLYLLNVIDIYASSRFLGAMYITLREVFPRVYVFATHANGVDESPSGRDTFIVIGALRELDLTELGKRESMPVLGGTLLTEKQMKVLEERSRGVVLTDDYSPVDNLLEIVVRRRAQQ